MLPCASFPNMLQVCCPCPPTSFQAANPKKRRRICGAHLLPLFHCSPLAISCTVSHMDQAVASARVSSVSGDDDREPSGWLIGGAGSFTCTSGSPSTSPTPTIALMTQGMIALCSE